MTEHSEAVARFISRLDGSDYRVNARELPGSPDIAFDVGKVAIFIRGCFWHQHRGCPNAQVPEARRVFWRAKMAKNMRRNRRTLESLRALGWRVVVIWECEL